jgi:predicted secreted hydrolase
MTGSGGVIASIERRALLLAGTAWPLALLARESIDYPPIVPRPLVFPRDHGAHPDFRTEWWYLTGWLDGHGGEKFGFQLTFFRVRTPLPTSASRFSPNQLIVGHTAIASTARGALLHEERVQRAGFGLVEAAQDETDVRIDRWRFAREAASGVYRGTIPARSFTLELTARPTQPILLQGRDGFSQKGPLAEQASLYYSQPQLAVQAQLTVDGAAQDLTGVGWLDHEWSSSVLADDAAGWDWIGMNLDDGTALTGFRIRRRGAGPAIHTYASLRPRGAPARIYGGDTVAFEPLALWRSPRTGAEYPVAQRVRIGDRTFETVPLMNDQELDARASTGAVYWEGASELAEGGRRVGRGYLEMTGYFAPMKL